MARESGSPRCDGASGVVTIRRLRGHLSSHSAIVSHPAFREIVSLGEPVVPLMLRDLAERPRLWVWALPEITGADPVPPGDGGRISKMSEAWLPWGREHGYQW